MLSDQAVKEFKEIYESEFEERLTDDQYRARAENFLRLMYLICKPIPQEEAKK